MKTKMLVITISALLAGVAALLAQTKPLEQMSDTERYGFFEEQKREVLKALPGVKVAAFVNPSM